eukprot:TRINITY_DN1756_c0_g1_i1.p1 TRINITY_DN1756_c0_g1~~TRINITY_DN1756_c0_g1_i1.p1  ORF type:complete len:464 (-),score=71.93 TRINITY_DN1756_c0_g1_i1:46-1437(-)
MSEENSEVKEEPIVGVPASNELDILETSVVGVTINDTNEATEGASNSPQSSLFKKHNAPALPFYRLFFLFLTLGCNAWGGPSAQISNFKQYFVVEEKWMTMQHFNKILAVYQVLPGPEATEMCCYFGYLSRGRLGSIVGGLGFALPGFVLMLLFSWIYVDYGLDNVYVEASFKAIQAAVSAFVVRACHRISEHCFNNSQSGQFDFALFFLAGFACVLSVMNLNLFLILGFSGVSYSIIRANYPLRFQKYKINWVVFSLWALICLGMFILYCFQVGFPKKEALKISIGGSTSPASLFLLGLLAGLLTFGGAYTAIPFLQLTAISAGWITNKQFLDGLGIGSILPSPLVIFVTFLGFVGARVPGAILTTLGMFLPAFSFTLIGVPLLEKVTEIKSITHFLDGVSASVVALISVAGASLIKSSITDQYGVILFMISLGAVYYFKHKITNPLIVFFSAVLGQIFYIG